MRLLDITWEGCVVRKRKLTLFTLVLAFVANALALASVVLLQNIWAMFIVLGIIVLDVYLCYFRFVCKREPRYPLVPPEGKPDMYLPRTDIPRPVIEDFRKIEEKKRKLAKLNKMLRKIVKPKKK